MALFFHVFCVTLINRRIACSGIHQLVLPFVILANMLGSMLRGTNQLHMFFVLLPNEVH